MEDKCIDCIKQATINKSPIEAIYVANIIESLWCYEDKGGLDDVRNAAWYVHKLIEELEDKSMKYKLVGTENGVAIETPWHTLMIPKEGDMFTTKDTAREMLLGSLLEKGGHCPCQPSTEDSICPCKTYREEGRCICGLFIKIPQAVVTNEEENVRTNPDTEDGEKE